MLVQLLPGMDGTGLLFRGLQKALPSEVRTVVVEYPRDRVLGYDQLLTHIPTPNEPYILVAESFSGPLAVQLAAQRPPNLMGVVLAATFVSRPLALPPWLISLLSSLLFNFPPPDRVLRWALLAPGASADDVRALRSALDSVQPQLLAERLRIIFDVDVRRDLERCNVPMLYIAAKRDRLVPHSASAVMAQLLPRMQITTLDGPHLILQSRPVEAMNLIMQFLKKLDG